MFKHYRRSGQLSSIDIKNEFTKKDGLRIFQSDPKNIKSASYDLTPTIIAMSAKHGMLETVYREKKYPFRYFITVKAKDTVLIVCNEYLRVPPYISGHIVSRVTRVTQGFGHISTSIDPNWDGALLIALSNPMNKPLKVYVGTNVLGLDSRNPLATVIFHYLNTPIQDARCEYPGMRIDLLKREHYANKTGFKQWIFKKTHFRRRAFTDFFFELCDAKKKYLGEGEWCNFVKQINGSENDESTKIKGRSKMLDFVVTETWYIRFLLWLQKHSWLWYVFLFGLLFVLWKVDLLSEELTEWIRSTLDIFS